MLIFGTDVRVREDRAVVAILESRDPRGVGAESEQHNVVHEPPIFRDFAGNPVGRARAIGGGQARFPVAGSALLAGPFDAAFDLVDAAEILLEPLTVRE